VADAAQPRRTQVERRSASEEALLTAAAALIAERGVEGASLARIGARAGASGGLPIHYFGSKDGLIASVADRAQNRIGRRIDTALELAERTMDEASGLELVRIMVGTYLELFEHPAAVEQALIVMWGATFPTDGSIEGMREADHASYDGWVTLLKRGQRDGSIRADVDPAAAGVTLLALTRGVAALRLTEPELSDARRVRATCDAWITCALAAEDDQKSSSSSQ
jgi:AcrR family transcriptional regulator